MNAEGSEQPATTGRAPHLTSEIEWIHAAKAGDAAAFGELIRANDAKMRGLAYRLVGDRTVMDDVLQDAYLKAFRSLHTYEPSGALFSSWLYRVVHSCAMDHHRKARRQPASSTEVNAELPTTDADLSDGAHAVLRRQLNSDGKVAP